MTWNSIYLRFSSLLSFSDCSTQVSLSNLAETQHAKLEALKIITAKEQNEVHSSIKNL